MTIKEYCTLLEKELLVIYKHYLKLDAELVEVDGFGEFTILLSYIEAKRNWQVAHNNFFTTISYFNKMGFDPNSEIVTI
jgi:hypothetical protein